MMASDPCGRYVARTATTSFQVTLLSDGRVVGAKTNMGTWAHDMATGDLVAFGGGTFRAMAGGMFVDTTRLANPHPDRVHELRPAAQKEPAAAEAEADAPCGGPAGIRNLGNTCYMAATMQMLRAWSGLAATYPDAARHLASAAATRGFVVDECGRSAFRPLIQHDAHEFLMTFLDCLPDDPPFPPREGRLRSTVTCPASGEVSHTETPFVVLSVPAAATLQESLKELQQLETLTAENRWRSPRIEAGDVPADAPTTKQLRILRLPHNDVGVIFHVKRFDYTGRRPRKIRTPMDVPLRWSTVPAAAREQQPLQLRAAVLHHGGPGGGHYTAIVLADGAWYLCDDRRVRPIDERAATAAAATAYLLLYASS